MKTGRSFFFTATILVIFLHDVISSELTMSTDFTAPVDSDQEVAVVEHSSCLGETTKTIEEATPRTVYEAAQRALAARDMREYVGLHTTVSQQRFAGMFVHMFWGKLGEPQHYTRAQRKMVALLERHGFGPERASERLEELKTDLEKRIESGEIDKELLRERMGEDELISLDLTYIGIGRQMKDPAAFAADALRIVYSEETPESTASTLVDFTVVGDKASGRTVPVSFLRPVTFENTEDGWRIGEPLTGWESK